MAGEQGTIDYLAHVRADAARIGEVVAAAPLDAAVPTCPGWTLRDLVHHLGGVHRWARIAAATGRRPDGADVGGPPADDDLAAWLTAGADELVATLATLDPDGPTWHPFPVPRVGAVWPRRQAHETAVHRWDAETVLGDHVPIDPLLAVDGIAEYVEVIVPRLVAREGIDPPAPIVVALTDVGVVLDVSVGRVAAGAGPPDVADAAADVLLALWGRRPPPAGASPGATRWFAVGGN